MLGTFGYFFAGTIVINDFSQGAISYYAFTFGLILMALIHSVGEILGVHLNPAVKFGFWAAKCFPAKEIYPYILIQLIGTYLTILHCKGVQKECCSCT